MGSRATARPVAGAIAATALVCCLAGCGGGSSPPRRSAAAHPHHLSPYARARADVCSTAARGTVAHFLRVTPATVTVRRTHDNAGAPECVFGHGHRAAVSLSVDGSPQPYGVLERRGEEQAQVLSTRRLQPAPIVILHLGLAAFWFPADQQLQTTDAVNLVTVSILHSPGASQRRRRTFSIALARRFLGPAQPSLAGSDG